MSGTPVDGRVVWPFLFGALAMLALGSLVVLAWSLHLAVSDGQVERDAPTRVLSEAARAVPSVKSLQATATPVAQAVVDAQPTDTPTRAAMTATAVVTVEVVVATESPTRVLPTTTRVRPTATLSAPSTASVPINGASSLEALNGVAMLVASDGTYLGVVSSNRYESDSICNTYGEYGSKYSASSIRNKY